MLIIFQISEICFFSLKISPQIKMHQLHGKEVVVMFVRSLGRDTWLWFNEYRICSKLLIKEVEQEKSKKAFGGNLRRLRLT